MSLVHWTITLHVHTHYAVIKHDQKLRKYLAKYYCVVSALFSLKSVSFQLGYRLYVVTIALHVKPK